MRKVSDIPANRLACYEWKPVDNAGQGGALPAKDAVVCVSVPYSDPPRAVATFDGEKFLLAGTQIILAGVTFWCHPPLTPEDLDAEATLEKKNASAEPELFSSNSQPGGSR